MKRTRRVRIVASLAFIACLAAANAAEAEICQLITYKFHPRTTDEAINVIATTLLPLYQDAPRTVVRLRVFREVASPTPLDLIVVGCFTGTTMNTLDHTNPQLLERARVKGINLRNAFERLAEMSTHQSSEFAEILFASNAQLHTLDGFHVFEYVRLSRSSDRFAFERMAPTGLRDGIVRSLETARLTVSDSWDFLRIVSVEDLAAYQRFEETNRLVRMQTENVVAARKTLIVKEDPDLRIP